jgi:hypothetical protein
MSWKAFPSNLLIQAQLMKHSLIDHDVGNYVFPSLLRFRPSLSMRRHLLSVGRPNEVVSNNNFSIFASKAVSQHHRFAQALLNLCSVTFLLSLPLTNHSSHLFASSCECCQLYTIMSRKTKSALRLPKPNPLLHQKIIFVSVSRRILLATWRSPGSFLRRMLPSYPS